MPRRPRPAHRRPPANAAAPEKPESSRAALQRTENPPLPQKTHKRHAPEPSSESGESEDDEDEDEVQPDEDSASEEDERDFADDVDVDAPRVAQWLDEEDLDAAAEEESGSEASSAEENPGRLQDDFASLPFGTLRKAQQALARASALDEPDSESEDDEDDSKPEEATSRPNVKAKGKEILPAKKEVPKRKNKHAPAETTSKKPVPRRKLETSSEKAPPRDPRFLSLAGEFSAKRFQSQYSFLSELHANEMKTLKGNLKRARKLLVNSPRNLQEEREQEVQRLEKAYKRAESMVNKDRREKVEQEALDKAAKEEGEKRKSGKKAWYMKKADKKDLLLRAKYEALAEAGGRRAVRKAIEKRQKKEGQKEKKRRPFAGGGGSGPPRKRFHGGEGDGARSSKRQRVG